jgi:hypothetical protein
MLNILVTIVLVVATVAALVSLVDSALVARGAVADLARERALARLGFVPQAAAQELRPRRMVRRAPGQLIDGSLRARALPLRFVVPSADAA